MPTQSAGNLTIWRQKPYRVYGHVLILKPTVVFAARVNMASVTYPVTSLTYDTVTTGAYTDIKNGMTVLVGSAAGQWDYGRQRVRAATSSIIQVGRSSRGTRDGELDIVDNAYITVLDLREVWAKIPLITEAGVSFKDEIAFSAGIAQPPIANGGPAVADFVNGSDELVVDFTAANSALVNPTGSLSYSWNFEDGTPASAATSTVNDVVFPPGFRYVELTVSDGARNHITSIPVYAAERTGVNAPIPVQVSTRTLRPEGQTISFEVRAADIDMADYPPGTLVIYFEEEYYGPAAADKTNLSGLTGRRNVKFVGWLDTEPTTIRATDKGKEKVVTLNALDVAGRLAKLPAFGQRIKRNDSPTTWQEMASPNIDRYLHHLLYWHSTALEVAPFRLTGFGGTYPFVDLGSDGGSLYQQVDRRAQAIAARLTCTSYGELLVRTDQQIVPTAERVYDTICTILSTDWSEVQYTYQRPLVKWFRSEAILASSVDSQPAFAIAPGHVPGQGLDDSEIGEQLVSSKEQLYDRVGNRYKRANPETTPFQLKLAHGGDLGLEPAFMEWVKWELSAAQAAQRGLTIPTDTRFMILQTVIGFNAEAKTHTVTLSLEREAIGFRGVDNTPPATGSPGETAPGYPIIPPGPVYSNEPFDPTSLFPPGYISPIQPIAPFNPLPLDSSGQKVLVATSDNQVLLITNFKTAMVNSVAFQYTDITPTLEENEVLQQAIWAAMGGSDAYVLTSLYTHYSEDALAGSLTSWTPSAALSGSYTGIRKTQAQGTVEILGLASEQGEGTWEYTFDFTIDDYSEFVEIWLPGEVSSPEFGYEPGTGYVVPYPGGYQGGLIINFPAGSDITTFQIWVTTGGSANMFGYRVGYADKDDYYTTESISSYPDAMTTLSGHTTAVAMNAAATVNEVVIDKIYIAGTGDDPFAGLVTTRLSDDYAATFEVDLPVGLYAGGVVGFDTQKVGSTIIANAAGQSKIAQQGDGYGDYGDPKGPGAIWIGRYRFLSTSDDNTDDYPDYLLFASEPDSGGGSGETLWRVTDSGYTYTDITPHQGGFEGVAVSANCVAMPWRSGYRIALIGDFNGTRRLKTYTDGQTDVDRGALSAGANYIRMRNNDLNVQELYIGDGTLIKYSPDFGATIYSKALPVSGSVISIEVLG